MDGGCLLFHIEAGLSEPPSTSLPGWFRKTGIGKCFWKKTCAYQSPSSFQRAGSCLNCSSLHTDPGTPGRKVHFGGALCLVFPRSPSCHRCSALGIRSHFPGGLACQGAPSARHRVPGLPARGGASPGAAVLSEDTDIPFQSPIPTHPAVPEPAAEERRMYCMRRLLH